MNRSRLLWFIAGWLMLAPVAVAGVPAQLEPTIRDRVIASAVQVAITFETNEGGATSQEFAPVGSGTVVSPDGLILTNAHVVDPAIHREQLDRWSEQARKDGKSLSFSLDEGRLVILFPDADGQPVPRYEAEVVERDRSLDLAVVRITGGEFGAPSPPGSLDLAFVPLGDSDTLALGDPIDVFGYPAVGGDSLTYSSGIVSGFLREEGVSGRAWIKSDASISGGSSGGTAVDRAGRLIGVPTKGLALDCRPGDTNGDGEVNADDVGCRPTGGSIGQLRPVNLAKPMLARAGVGQESVAEVAQALPTSTIAPVVDDGPTPTPRPADQSTIDRQKEMDDAAAERMLAPDAFGSPGFDTESNCLTSPIYGAGEVLLLSRDVEVYIDSQSRILPAGTRLRNWGFIESGVCDRYALEVDETLSAADAGQAVDPSWANSVARSDTQDIDERLVRREGAAMAYPRPMNIDTMDRFDCDDFETKAEALAFFAANGGPLYDPSNLDPDGNGLICVGLP